MFSITHRCGVTIDYHSVSLMCYKLSGQCSPLHTDVVPPLASNESSILMQAEDPHVILPILKTITNICNVSTSYVYT